MVRTATSFRYEFDFGGNEADFDFDESTGEFSFVATSDFETPTDTNEDNIYTFTVTAVSLANPDSRLQTEINLAVANVPEAFDQVIFTQNENEIVDHQLSVDGADSNSFRYEFDFGGNEADFDFNENTGQFSFVAAPDFEAPTDGNEDNIYTFSVTAVSLANPENQLEAEFNLVVNNEPEAFDQVSFSQNENETVEHQIRVAEDDSSSFRYEFVFGDNEADFDFNESTGEFSFIAAPDFEAPTDGNEDNIYTFTVTAVSLTDPDSRLQTEISLAVANVPEAFDQVFFTQNENEIVDHQLSVDGVDSSFFDYKFDFGDNEADFNFNENTGEFSFVAAPDFEAPADGNEDNVYTFTVTAVSLTDPDSRLQTEISLAVANVPEAFDQILFSQNENEIVDHQLSVDGADSSSFTYEFDFGGNEADFDFNENTGEFSFVAAPDFEAPTDGNEDNIYTFTVTAVSTENPENQLETEINLVVINDFEIVAKDDSAEVIEGGTVQLDVLANDTIDPLDRLASLEVVSSSNGTAAFNENGQIEFIHDGSETTSAEVTYRIVNQEGDFSSATVNIVVNPLADTTPDELQLTDLQGTTFSIADQIVENDFVGGPRLTDFKVDIVDGPSQGIVTVDNQTGDLVFTPNAEFSGVDSFSYRLISIDGTQVLSQTAAVSIELAIPAAIEPAIVTPAPVTSTPAPVTSTPNPVLPPPPAPQIAAPATPNTANFGPSPVPVAPLTTSGELADAIQQTAPTLDSIATQQGYVAPEDFGAREDRVDLTLEFEGNVYTYYGRTQFLELADLELSQFDLQDSFQSETDQGNQLLLNQLILGVSSMSTSNNDDASPLSVGNYIFKNAPLIGVTTFVAISVLTTATFTGSQLHRIFDVGSLLDDESIEDIVAS